MIPHQDRTPASVAPRPPRPEGRSFSLLDIIVATTLGAMLLVSVAELARMFGHDFETPRDETAWRFDESMLQMVDGCARALTVEVPRSNELVVTDGRGGVTRFKARSGSFEVTRPDGVHGTLLDDVQEFVIEPRYTQRLRDAPPLVTPGAWFHVPPNQNKGLGLVIEQDLPVAIGFTLSNRAPDWVHTVEGVVEQTRHATFERLMLPLVYVPPVGDGPLDTRFVIDLHQAATPGDGRPYGPTLASVALSSGDLPRGLDARAPDSAVTLDISSLDTFVAAGRAHTLVLRLEGPGQVLLGAQPSSDGRWSGVAAVRVPGEAFTQLPVLLPRTLIGERVCTQTVEVPVIESVTLRLTRPDGEELTGSADIISQLAVADPWLGNVPGERIRLESHEP